MFVCLIYGVEICRIATSQGLRFHALPGAHRQVSRWWYHMYPYLLSSKTIQNCQSWETINYPFIYIYITLLYFAGSPDSWTMTSKKTQIHLTRSACEAKARWSHPKRNGWIAWLTCEHRKWNTVEPWEAGIAATTKVHTGMDMTQTCSVSIYFMSHFHFHVVCSGGSWNGRQGVTVQSAPDVRVHVGESGTWPRCPARGESNPFHQH